MDGSLGIALGTVLLGGALAAGVAAVSRASRGDRRGATLSLGALVAVVTLGAATLGGDLAMQKLASYLVMPVGLLWIAMLALTAHLWARGVRGASLACASIFAAYSLLGSPFVSAALMRALEREVPAYPLGAPEVFDAVLVLGGGVGFRDAGRDVQLGEHGDRVIMGARLYRAGKARRLVASGSTIAGFDRVEDLADAAARLWIELGIPEEVIVRSPEPKNTSQELARFQQLAAERSWGRLGVISSRWHLPRILRGARAIGLSVTPIAADHRGARPPFHPALLVPQAGAMRTTQMVAWELVGAWVGR